MKRLLQPPSFPDEEQQRLARILYILLGALLAAGLILLWLFWTGGLYWPGIIGMSVGIGLVLAAVALVRAGYLQMASLAALLALAGVVTYLVVTGGGLHDVAMLAFPVILVAAALLVTRRRFIAISLFMILITTVIGAAELTGWLVNPFSSGTSLNDVVSVVIVLALTALTARLLADNLLHSLERFRHELAERRRTEEAYHTVVENSMEGLAIFQNQRLAFTNPAFHRLIGYSEAELAAMSSRALLGLVYPADRRALAAAQRAAASGVRRHESRFVRKDGAVRWLEGTLTPVTYRGQAALQAAFVDISERRQVADVLHSGDERFRALVQNSSDVITLLSPDGTILYDSPAITRVLGYGPEERLGTNAFAAIHPDDVQEARAAFRRLFGKPDGAMAAELRLRHTDGSWRWVEMVGANLLHVPGVQAMVANYRDITQRKRAETELREAEARYRVLVEQLPAIVFLIEFGDPSRLVYISPQGRTLFGLSAEKWQRDADGWLQIVHPDDRPTALAAAHRILDTGQAVEFEFRATTLAGREMWFTSQWAILPDASGQPRYAQGLLYDITERRRAEEDLRRSETHNRALLSAIPDLLFQLDASGRFTGFQASHTGNAPAVPPEAFVGKLIGEVLGPEIGAQTESAVRQALGTGEVQTFEYSMPGAAGPREFEARVTPSGPGEVIALARDITSSKQAERSLQRSLARMEILHNIDSAILVAQSPEATAQAALEPVRELVGAQRVSASLFDFSTEQAYLLAVSSAQPTHFPAGERMSFDVFGRYTVEALQGGQPFFIEDVSTQVLSEEDRQLATEGVRAFVIIPLEYKGELIGSLNLGLPQSGRAAPELVEIAQEVAAQLAIAIQSARLFTQTSEALLREQRLNEVVRTISSSLNLPEVLQNVMRLAVEIIKADAGSLDLLADDGQSITDAYSFNVPSQLVGQTLPRGRGAMWQVVDSGHTVMITGYPQRPEALPEWKAFGVQTFLGAPISAGDHVLGSLTLFSLDPQRSFSARDLSLVESIGRQAGVAIQNARLFEATQQRNRETIALLASAEAISATLEFEDALRAVAEQAVRLMDANGSRVHLIEPDGVTLRCVIAREHEAEQIMAMQLKVGQGFTGRVAQTGQPLRALSPDSQGIGLRVPGTPDEAECLALVPLKWQERVIGVMTVIRQGHEHPFTESEQRVLTGLAAHASSAIVNARLFESARQELAERERAQAQLRISDEILKRVASLVLVADPDGRITFASESFKTVLGLEPEQLLGEGWWQYRGAGMAGEREAITREARGEAPLRAPQYENTVTDAAGRTHWILWQDVLGPAGTIIGVGHDITERKRSEEKLREAELRFRTLVEHNPAITYIISLDRPAQTLYVSPQVEQVLGYTPAEWANDDVWTRQLHPEDRERVLAADRHAHESGEPFSQEYRVIGKDGRTVWLHDESRWVRDESGRPIFAQGIEFDITERKRAEEQLREAEVRFRTLVEQSPAIIYIVPPSADQRPIYVSPQIEPILGFTPEEWLSDPGLWGKLLHPEDREAVLAHELHTRRNTQPFSLEYRIFRKDGQVVWLHDEARWIVDEAGQPLFAQGIEFDISDRKRAETDIARQLREIQALYQISQLLAGTLALEDILQKIAEAAASVMQRADRVVMHLVDSSGKILEPVALAGPEEGNVKERVNFRWGQGLAGLAIATGQTVNVPDAPKDARYVPTDNLSGRVHSLAVAPVQAGDKRLGTLSVHSHAVGAFTAEDERLLTTLAVQAGLAIEKARLFEAERRRAEEAEALQQVTRTLINRRRLRELLQDAVDAIALITKYRYIVINLRERDTLVPIASTGYDLEALPPISVHEGITGRVARTGVPIIVQDTDLDPDVLDIGPRGTSFIGVPLALSDRLLGVLTVEAPPTTPLDDTDLNWLMNVGRQISTAVENARLNSDLETALQQEKAARSQLVQSEKLASMGKLVASVAHELNNPLQAIQNALFLVAQEVGLSDQTRADLEVAAIETHRMADLIARLRDTYRPTTSEQFQPESLNAVVEDVQRLIATHLRHSHITVEFRSDPNLPALSAIRDQLKQAVLNLCINAVEAMPDGGQLTIESRYAAEVDEICLTITDTGMGIDPADLPNVFDPFFTTKATGTGLGLAITHDIARRHGGRLEATSRLGHGSTFILCLPVGGPPAGAGILQTR